MTDLLTVDESIDREALHWERWGGMVRHHPNFLGATLALLPKARDEEDSIRRLVAIYHWLKALDVDLCDLCVEENYDPRDLQHKLHPYISFGNSPYGPGSKVPLIGTHYNDPEFPQIQDQEWRTSSILNLRDQRSGHNDESLEAWARLVKKAEKDYFDNDIQAPVCVFEWELGAIMYSNQRSVISWLAGNTIIDMEAGKRRSISGYRSNTHLPDFAMEGAPENIKSWRGDFQLKLMLYQPSALLMAQREANKLDGNTVNITTSASSSRRVL